MSSVLRKNLLRFSSVIWHCFDLHSKNFHLCRLEISIPTVILADKSCSFKFYTWCFLAESNTEGQKSLFSQSGHAGLWRFPAKMFWSTTWPSSETRHSWGSTHFLMFALCACLAGIWGPHWPVLLTFTFSDGTGFFSMCYSGLAWVVLLPVHSVLLFNLHSRKSHIELPWIFPLEFHQLFAFFWNERTAF